MARPGNLLIHISVAPAIFPNFDDEMFHWKKKKKKKKNKKERKKEIRRPVAGDTSA